MAEADTGRGLRRERKGVVVSKSGDKTVVVQVEQRRRHPLYSKVVRHKGRFHAHDEKNECSLGDRVRIVECRPFSRHKRWRLVEIMTAAPKGD